MNYRLIRKKRNKKAYIRVVDGEVIVTVPYYMSEKEIDSFVNRSENWIAEQVSKNSLIQTNDKIFLLGREYIVQFHDRPSCFADNEYLYLIRNKEIIDEFILKNIKNYMEIRFQFFCSQLDIHEISLKFSTYKSKWGSCTPKKRLICFNINLIFMPLDFIDAIILHELAHLYYLNHGKNFYDLLLKWMPNYKLVIKNGKEYQVPRLY